MKENRLYQKYVDTVRPALVETWKYKNIHQIPRLEKIVVRPSQGVSRFPIALARALLTSNCAKDSKLVAM